MAATGVFECYGEGTQFFKWVTGEEPAPRECMFEGVAGGGKSRIWGEYLKLMGEVFPGSKHLIIRQTRVSLNESWLDIWEDEVLGPGHLALVGARKEHRSFYEFPPAWGQPMRAWCPPCKAALEAEGGTYQPKRFCVSPAVEIRRFRCQSCGGDMDATEDGKMRAGLRSRYPLGGMDNATRLFSTQYNTVYWNEMQEGELEDWESLHRSLRRTGTPYWLLGGDCNPEEDTHWANLRAGASEAGYEQEEGEAPKLHRIVSHFTDNPTVDQEYVDRLFENLTGPRRERLAKGLWCAAEGMVWPDFRRRIHVLQAQIAHLGEPDPDTGVPQGPVNLLVKGWPDPVRLQWFLAGLDFGFNAPGCLGIWGFDRDGRMFEVAEVYRTGWTMEQWAEWAVRLYREFPFEALICDHDPEAIKRINDLIGPECGNPLEALAIEWDKRRFTKNGEKAGIDTVRARMKDQGDGRPGIFWLDGNVRGGVDPDLKARKKPLCTVQEIGGYVYPTRQDGKKDKEDPDPNCPDHGCDQTRAVAYWAWLKDLSPEEQPTTYHPRSYGALLGHDEVGVG